MKLTAILAVLAMATLAGCESDSPPPEPTSTSTTRSPFDAEPNRDSVAPSDGGAMPELPPATVPSADD